MSAPASAASTAAAAAAPTPARDRVLSIVDDLNSKFTQWLSLNHKRKRATTTAELALEADVTGLSESDRTRLRDLLACHGFDVVAVIPTSSDGRESIALFRGAAPAAATQNDDDAKEKEEHTECSTCKAPAAPDFVKLPKCGHIFCPKCTRHMLTVPDCRCCESCAECHTVFLFDDMQYLDGTSYETNQSPSKRQKTTDPAKAEASE